MSLPNRIKMAAALCCAAGLLAGACADDDPGAPASPPPPDLPFAVSPDSLVSLYTIALAAQDSAAHQGLFADGFRYEFSDVDVGAYGLTTDHMTRAEVLQAAGNILAGDDLVPGRDGLIPGVVRIVVHEFAPQAGWAVSGGGSPFPGTEVCRHVVRIDLERPFGTPTVGIFGELDVYAVALRLTDSQGVTRVGYKLAGMVDPQESAGAADDADGGSGGAAGDRAKAETYTWGMAHSVYLDNRLPTPILAIRCTGTFPVPGYELLSAGTYDADSGLDPEPFRWRADADSAWSDWRTPTLARFSYAVPGPVTVGLEVRDRWGLASVLEIPVAVPPASLPFPGEPDSLMAFFRTVYDHQVAGLIDDVLAAGHVSYLDDSAQQAYPTAGSSFDRAAELASAARLFDGQEVTDPLGGPVPPVGLISFFGLQRLTAWTVAGEQDRVPGAMKATYTVSLYLNRWEQDDLKVAGFVDFYAVSRDSLHEGELRPFWQLIAQDDLDGTKPVGAGSEVGVPAAGDPLDPRAKEPVELSWSGLKAMFRAADPGR